MLLAKVLGTEAKALSAAAAFGTLAGTFGVRELSGIEVVLGTTGPDVVVWAVISAEPQMSDFENALADPGPLLAAFDYDQVGRVRLLRMSEDTLVALAETSVSKEERESLVDALLARNVRIGGMYASADFTWVADDAGMAVWRSNELVASRATPPANAGAVVIHLDRVEEGLRSVRYALLDGGCDQVAVHDDPMARLDPGYNGNDLFLDTMWAYWLAEHLAIWSQLPLINETEAKTDQTLFVIARATRAASDQLRSGARALTMSIAIVHETMWTTIHVPDTQDVVELLVGHVDGSVVPVTLERGTPGRLAAYLRRVTTPRDVLRAMNRESERWRAVYDAKNVASAGRP